MAEGMGPDRLFRDKSLVQYESRQARGEQGKRMSARAWPLHSSRLALREARRGA